MRLILRFQFYSDKELAELVRLRSIGLRWPLDAEVLPEIAKRSRGIPRLALRLLQSCRVCVARWANTPSPSNIFIVLAHLNRSTNLAWDRVTNTTSASWPTEPLA